MLQSCKRAIHFAYFTTKENQVLQTFYRTTSIATYEPLQPSTVIQQTMSPPSPRSKKHSKQLRWTWRKPPDKPKRPLSAYNLFFADVRRKLLEQRRGNGAPTHGIGFSNLAKTVAKQWKVRTRTDCLFVLAPVSTTLCLTSSRPSRPGYRSGSQAQIRA